MDKPSHVIGKIAEADKYVGLHPRFAKAFAFLKRPDLARLAVGRYEIDGDDCWATVSESPLHPFEGAKLEAHRKYIDIQAPLIGNETYGLALMDARALALPFDVEKDYVLFEGESKPVTLHPGQFILFFPPLDAHAPCCSPDGEPTVKKVIIKVRAD